ncbi:hypothetical protein CYMTET_28208 [Cymbomonas tetramitiformis]|uniref:Uncharacterized protein n=1 Tax=Cymbomonas tetramitiformis TaxID=36881 RepID=A0AAE0KW62_9CHLO|nr:hypothetical protein CYMTET_28208 [Cymbomonas tetramitiformis]
MPADDEGAAEDMHTLALCHICQVAADDGAEAFAAAVAEYGAPAVLTGDESDGIDVSAYVFSAPGTSGVLTELEGHTIQVKARGSKAEERRDERITASAGGAAHGRCFVWW